MSGQIFNTWESELVVKGKVEVEDMRKYSLRSAVLPGWGQIHKGQTLKGSIFGISLLSLTFLLYKENQNYKNQLSLYEKNNSFGMLAINSQGINPYLLSEEKRYEQSITSSANKAKNISLLLIGIYLWNVLDAHYSPLSTTKSPVNVQASWNPVYGKEYSFSYTISF